MNRNRLPKHPAHNRHIPIRLRRAQRRRRLGRPVEPALDRHQQLRDRRLLEFAWVRGDVQARAGGGGGVGVAGWGVGVAGGGVGVGGVVVAGRGAAGEGHGRCCGGGLEGDTGGGYGGGFARGGLLSVFLVFLLVVVGGLRDFRSLGASSVGSSCAGCSTVSVGGSMGTQWLPPCWAPAPPWSLLASPRRDFPPSSQRTHPPGPHQVLPRQPARDAPPQPPPAAPQPPQISPQQVPALATPGSSSPQAAVRAAAGSSPPQL
ncbi:hypothetical protein BD626DRAFT_154400 [Schizophyllum amplum]|uniref:Uncharacterized protein n=1 Tax=Schizophyllum amplum TaxID=97359 RepID=A0A550C3M7_9AGAR|nr:hypothetical protein BD626DRAFT_154400 [Auriculariopsis ampla]